MRLHISCMGKYESSVSGINFQKKMDAKPVSKEEFYRKKVKPISPKL